MVLENLLKRDNNNLDAIRLLAALMVMWHHALISIPNSFPSLIRVHPYMMDLGHIGVAIFFFISGLLVTNSILSKKSVPQFVVSRFFRIYPAFFVYLLVIVFIAGPFLTSLSVKDYFSSGGTWHYFKNNLLLRHTCELPGVFEGSTFQCVNGSIWTIPFEVTLYVLVMTVFIICNRLKINHLYFLIPAFIVSLMPQDFMWKTLGIQWIYYDRGDFFNFLVGSTMAIYKDKIRLDKTVVYAFIILIVIFWRWNEIIYYLFPLTVAIVLLFASTIKPIINLQLKHDISYGTYIWHAPIMATLCIFFNYESWLILFLATTSITLPVAWLSARFIEEPALRLSKHIGQRQFNIPDNGIFVLALLALAILISKFCF